MKKLYSFIIMLLIIMFPCVVFAEEDTAGNLFVSDEDTVASFIQRDLLWAGGTLNLTDTEIAKDAFIAGQTLTIDQVTLGGSLRIAGETINVDNTEIDNNINAAARTITIGKGVKAAGVYLASASLSFSGEGSYLAAYADSVTFNGVVNGDAKISGNKITIGENAVVTGTLSIDSSVEPTIPSSAKIGKVEFTATPVEETGSGSEPAKTESFGSKLLSMFVKILSMLIVTALWMIIAPKQIVKSSALLKNSWLKVVLTGFITMLAIPVLVVLLVIFDVTRVAGVIILLLFIVALAVAGAFVGAFVGNLVLPKMNKWASAMIGAAVVGIVGLIPYIGGVVVFACMVLSLGSWIQIIYDNLKPTHKALENSDETPTLTGFTNTEG